MFKVGDAVSIKDGIYSEEDTFAKNIHGFEFLKRGIIISATPARDGREPHYIVKGAMQINSIEQQNWRITFVRHLESHLELVNQ